jgi:hypothetical protein
MNTTNNWWLITKRKVRNFFLPWKKTSYSVKGNAKQQALNQLKLEQKSKTAIDQAEQQVNAGRFEIESSLNLFMSATNSEIDGVTKKIHDQIIVLHGIQQRIARMDKVATTMQRNAQESVRGYGRKVQGDTNIVRSNLNKKFYAAIQGLRGQWRK